MVETKMTKRSGRRKCSMWSSVFFDDVEFSTDWQKDLLHLANKANNTRNDHNIVSSVDESESESKNGCFKTQEWDLVPIGNTISSSTCSRDGIKIEGTVNKERLDLTLVVFLQENVTFYLRKTYINRWWQ